MAPAIATTVVKTERIGDPWTAANRFCLTEYGSSRCFAELIGASQDCMKAYGCPIKKTGGPFTECQEQCLTLFDALSAHYMRARPSR